MDILPGACDVIGRPLYGVGNSKSGETCFAGLDAAIEVSIGPQSRCGGDNLFELDRTTPKFSV